ncbi:MAG TPA: G1 family glutamic endopeptidase [Ktedonobacteraceae bacterium]|nr:G1 family glutamic endopeptidase [Ktedonobacteraceae bacterium]
MLRFRNWMALILLTLISGVSILLAPYASAASNSSKLIQKAGSVCLQPPKNIDLLTLSDAQLQSYGLPTHSIINTQPKTWARFLSHGLLHTCGSYPDKKHSTHALTIPNAIHCGGIPGDMCPNTIWAGNEDVGSRGTYTQVTVEFKVPTIPTSPSNALVYIWAGVGGNNYVTPSAVLVQAGILVEPNGSKQYNESFWQVTPGYDSIQNLPLCYLYQGNTVFVSVASNSDGSGQDYFYMENESAPYPCYNSYTTSNSQYFSDSATGECIVEKDSSGLLPLANFGTEAMGIGTIYGCQVYDNRTYVTSCIGNFPHNYLQIYRDPNNLNTLLANVGPITNGGCDYNVYWRGGS